MVFLIETRFSPSFSVKHPPYKDALEKYIFQIAGQRLLDDQLVYDISAKPKTNSSPDLSAVYPYSTTNMP
jgi:hypothetical protein